MMICEPRRGGGETSGERPLSFIHTRIFVPLYRSIFSCVIFHVKELLFWPGGASTRYDVDVIINK